MTDTHIVVQRAADVGPIDGGHEGEVLPILALQVVKVLVPGSAVSGEQQAPQWAPGWRQAQGTHSC